MHDEFRKRTQEALELAHSFGFKGTEQALVDILEAHECDLLVCSKDTTTSELLVKANIETDQGKYLDLYSLDVDESNSYISIVSNAKPLFKAFHKEREQSGRKQYYYTDDMYEFNYVFLRLLSLIY